MNSSTQNIQTVTNHDIEAASAAKAPWETWIEEDILPEIDPVTNATTIKLLDVIRALLKAPDDDLEAASRAVAEYQSYFRSTYLDTESKDGWYLRNLPKNGSSLVDPLCQYSWEMASMFPPDSVKHRRLAEFVAGFKKPTSQSFDPKVYRSCESTPAQEAYI